MLAVLILGAVKTECREISYQSHFCFCFLIDFFFVDRTHIFGFPMRIELTALSTVDTELSLAPTK